MPTIILNDWVWVSLTSSWARAETAPSEHSTSISLSLESLNQGVGVVMTWPHTSHVALPPKPSCCPTFFLLSCAQLKCHLLTFLFLNNWCTCSVIMSQSDLMGVHSIGRVGAQMVPHPAEILESRHCFPYLMWCESGIHLVLTAWWYHTMLCLQKEGVLGLVNTKEYYEYLCLAGCAALSCACAWPQPVVPGHWLQQSSGMSRNGLKQGFEPETAASCLEKLNKNFNAPQGTNESIVRFGGRICGLLCEYELWPASYFRLTQGGPMDSRSPLWAGLQLPVHQEWLHRCREAGCGHLGTCVWVPGVISDEVWWREGATCFNLLHRRTVQAGTASGPANWERWRWANPAKGTVPLFPNRWVPEQSRRSIERPEWEWRHKKIEEIREVEKCRNI